MLVNFIQKFETSVGLHVMLTEVNAENPTTRNLAGKMFLVPYEFIDDVIGVFTPITEKQQFEIPNGFIDIFALPETAHPQGHRQNRLIKYALKLFYEANEVNFTPWEVAYDMVRIRAACEAYDQIAMRRCITDLRRSHFQHVSKEYVRIPGLNVLFPVTRICTHYPHEGVTIVKWNLGDDQIDFLEMNYADAQGFKRLVDPLMTMSIHRHYANKPIQSLQQIVDSNDLHGQAVSYFYHRRRIMLEYQQTP